MEVVDFVFWTRTTVINYFLDVAGLQLKRFIQLRGLVGDNHWIQGVSVGHRRYGVGRLITRKVDLGNVMYILMLSYT